MPCIIIFHYSHHHMILNQWLNHLHINNLHLYSLKIQEYISKYYLGIHNFILFEKVRANDTNFRFRPATEFFYLTGNDEADCVLVLKAKSKGVHTSILFAEPNPGRTDPTFFTDRHKGELWVGPRLGVSESEHRFQIDRCMSLGQLGFVEVIVVLFMVRTPCFWEKTIC